MNIAVVLSAGSGTRFDSKLPKQLVEIGNRSILSYSLEKLQNSDCVDLILVVAHPDHVKSIEEEARVFSKFKAVVIGGERRQDSVFNALKWIESNDINCKSVLIHDSARPLFSTSLLKRLSLLSKDKKAVIPVIAVDDTLKSVKGDIVDRTVDRSEVVRVQTPQVFDFKVLYDCYMKLPKDKVATDDAFVVESCGIEVSVVQGERNNIKITYLEDLEMAETMLKKEF